MTPHIFPNMRRTVVSPLMSRSRVPLWHYIYLVPIVPHQRPFSLPPHAAMGNGGVGEVEMCCEWGARRNSPHRQGRHQEILYHSDSPSVLWYFIQRVFCAVVERLVVGRSMVTRRSLSLEKHAEAHLESRHYPFLYWLGRVSLTVPKE